ncbi:hypothetical protein B0T10DRAFT_463896 [Thelonectria olida]|uniref:DUF6603 domain-containing protein n=1 Tax=Thelonectria olida TaxID=1576542 RepID=A0A9P8VYS0_9HYPO|nr:hypothetical protein B0T10DRAFT_463896 [Thelonectria olida]
MIREWTGITQTRTTPGSSESTRKVPTPVNITQTSLDVGLRDLIFVSMSWLVYLIGAETFYRDGNEIKFGVPPNKDVFAEFVIDRVPDQFQEVMEPVEVTASTTPIHFAAPAGLPLPLLQFPVSGSAFSSESSLREAFKCVGEPIHKQDDPEIISTLHVLFGDKSLLVATLKKLPESILQAVFGGLRIDLGKSKAIVAYDYRFRILGASEGVVVPDIAAAIGLDDVSSKMIDAVPGCTVFLILSIPFFDIIPGSLHLADTWLRVERFRGEGVRAKGEAVFWIPKLEKEAKVSLGLPTMEEPGYITLSAPGGFTLADAFEMFGLGDLSHVPVPNEIGMVQMTYCDAKFVKPSKLLGKIEVSLFTAKFYKPMLKIGRMEVKGVEFSLSWQRGRGTEDGGRVSKSTVSFELSGQLQNLKSLMRVTYGGEKRELSASISPIKTFPMKVVDVLSALVPGVDSALHSTFVGLSMKVVPISLDLTTAYPSAFKMEFGDDSELALPSATDNTTFSLKSLRLEYVRSVNKFDLFATVDVAGTGIAISLSTLTNATSGERQVNVGIALQEKDPGLKALLAKFGIQLDQVSIPAPEECPEFNLGLSEIEGKFIDKEKFGLKLAELKFQVESTEALKAVEDWDISVDKLFLEVEYNNANTRKPFSAVVLSKLTIAKAAEVTIAYINTKDGDEFQVQMLAMKGSAPEVKVGSILQWLLGDSVEESLPSFISEAVIDLDETKFNLSLSRRKASGKSALSLLVYWANNDVSTEEVNNLKTLVTFKKQKLLLSGKAMKDVGLDYVAKVKFTASETIGPLDGYLINFTMIVNLPQGESIQLSNWKKIGIEIDLDGLSLGMTGSNLNVTGFLQRIKLKSDDMAIEGFEGGIGTSQGNEFVSLMVFTMLQGPILTTPYVEIRGISDGFGIGSQLLLPPVTEINTFPLLMGPSSDPLVAFDKLRGTGSRRQYITETNGANWVAAGILATACELIDISAVLTHLPLRVCVADSFALQFRPSIGK